MNDNDSPQNANIAINSEISAKITHYKNIDQNLITTTEDKLELLLIKYANKLENKKSWLTPLGIFITLFLVPLTTEKFKDAFSIPAAVWQAIFYLGIVISFFWLIGSLYSLLWVNRKITIDYIINQLKKN